MIIIKLVFRITNFLLFYIANYNTLIPKVALIWQENQRYKRYFQEKQLSLPFTADEKIFICGMYSKRKNINKYFSIVTPNTVLYIWQKMIKDYWKQPSNNSRPGRPRISKEVKVLIKNMKIDNYLWGCRRIRDELLKLDIEVSRETIRKVIYDYRKENQIKPNYSWKKFIKTHWNSLFSCDFLTVDLFGFKRLYVFFILQISSRKIVHFNITTNPNISFIRHQISHFEELYPNSYLIHDNSGELKYFPYNDYEIKSCPTSPYAPNMNAYAERFIKSIRNECLDWFIIFKEKQLRKIIKEYVHYYNNFRPHQGIKGIPNNKSSPPKKQSNKIVKKPVLF